MAPSIIEKYEQIFAADPRSRIFVELARALLERGDAARAIEVCRTGLEHHPSSILGRVIWGRGLLAQGDLPGAQQQFDRAVELDPTSPYAFNLVGEALYAKQLYREALPILARAVELQPGDDRLRGWLEQAQQKAGPDGAGARSNGTNGTKTPIFGQAPAPVRPARAAAPGAPTPVPGAVPLPGPTDTIRIAAPRSAVPLPAPAAPASQGGPTGTVMIRAAAAPEPPTGTVILQRQPPPTGTVILQSAPPPTGTVILQSQPSTGTVLLPPKPPPAAPDRAAPPPLSPALHRDEIPRSLLALIPSSAQPAAPAHPAAPEPPPDEEEAEQITARYAQEVRARLQAEGDAPPSFARRHFRLLAGLLLAAAVAGAVVLFLHLRETGRGEAFARAAAAARAGLARDTLGALRQAEGVLGEARKGGTTPELTSLTAQVEALLAVDYGDDKARALAGELAQQPEAGDGGVAAAYLLARPSEQFTAESAVLAAPEDSAPLVQELAGRILLKRGETARARERFLRAANATPPSLRALADLGDLELAAGKPEAALAYFGAAPDTDETRAAAQRLHARSVIGAAEARLALGQDLARARADLEALEAAPAGAASSKALRVRQEVATARVLFATGDPAAAVTRLSRATVAVGDTAPLAVAAAEIHLAMRAYDRAEASAARAVALQPGDSAARVLLARARIGRGKYADAITATGTAEGRAIWLQRGIARYRLGQYPEAERELVKTAPTGQMPPEAAVWYALTRMRLGHGEEAVDLLQRLAAGRAPPPLTYVALGEVLAKLGRAEEAESAWRSAIERDPSAPEGHAALGLALQARGADEEAVAELQKALAADPSDFKVRYALGAARLATGHPALARAELDAVLLARPADLDALCLLSQAWLAEGQPKEARRAADRGLARAPGNPSLLLAAGRAAFAQGDASTARSLAERAVKSAGRGPLADEARAFRASLKRK